MFANGGSGDGEGCRVEPEVVAVNDGAGESARMARRSSSRSAALSTTGISFCVFRVFIMGSHLQKPAFVIADELGILKVPFVELGLGNLEFRAGSSDISFSEEI